MIKKRSFSIFYILSLTLLAWWSLELTFGLWTGVDGLGFKAHKLCTKIVNHRGQFDFLNLKLLCSYTLSHDSNSIELEIQMLFIHLGLVHLLVASGSHLLIIRQGVRLVFKHLRHSQTIVYICLFIFVLGSNFCIPVTRCFAQVCISSLAKKYSLCWSAINLTIASSIIYLLFFPKSVIELSFWLSVSASLCLAFFSKNLLYASFGFFFILYPFITDFGAPSVTSVVINILITPLLGPALIWNSVFYVFLPFYDDFGNLWLMWLIKILKILSLISLDLSSASEQLINSHKPNLISKILYGIFLVLIAMYFQKLKVERYKYDIKSGSEKN